MEPSQLLFISDIEGCLEKQGAIDQNVSLCNSDTYSENGPLHIFLSKNSKNKIAFLGDYFDKGPGVASSIKGIRSLHKSFPDRVHIILGNRDVNKFRLGYEVMQTQAMTPDKDDVTKWVTWKDFYPVYETTNDNFTRFTTILNKSMGAGPDPDGAIISYELNKLLDENNRPDKNKAARIGAYYLTKVFDDNADYSHFGINENEADSITDLKTFVEDCRYLFTNGDIVKGDDDYKVLMSHAGGFNKCILQPETFYNGIMETKSIIIYFDDMERMRRALTCNGSESGLVDITKAVTYHNNLYKTFVNNYFKSSTDRNTLLPQHLLLQAMGLKPDGALSKFASFIQSCGSGCGIVNDDNESNEFISKLGGYKAVAHGHVPHCMRHPLLISRNDIVFISNDTSNGNRPTNLGESLSSLPLSYIQKEKNYGIKYGIGFIETDGTIRTPNFDEMKFKNNGTEYTNPFLKQYVTLALIGGPYSLCDIPNADTVKKYIKWNGFGPADIDTPKGGSSTRKNQKRGGKKNTRRIVKNKRKTKRRSKHHCSHCK